MEKPSGVHTDLMNVPEGDSSAQRRFSAITTSRIETLADGVFAIVMTLLVFDIRVPTTEFVEEVGLLSSLFTLIPNLFSYFLSFLILGVLWVGHHNQFFYIKRADRTLLWINIFFMMCIALVPFSAAVLARYNSNRISIILYDINLIFAGLLLFYHWWYATRDNHLLNQTVEPHIRRLVTTRILIPPALYAFDIFICLWSPGLALIINVIVPLIYIFPNSVDRIFKRI